MGGQRVVGTRRALGTEAQRRRLSKPAHGSPPRLQPGVRDVFRRPPGPFSSTDKGTTLKAVLTLGSRYWRALVDPAAEPPTVAQLHDLPTTEPVSAFRAQRHSVPRVPLACGVQGSALLLWGMNCSTSSLVNGRPAVRQAVVTRSAKRICHSRTVPS